MEYQMWGECYGWRLHCNLSKEAKPMFKPLNRCNDCVSIYSKGTMVAGPYKWTLWAPHWCRDDFVQRTGMAQATVAKSIEGIAKTVLHILVACHAPFIPRKLISSYFCLLLHIDNSNMRTWRSEHRQDIHKLTTQRHLQHKAFQSLTWECILCTVAMALPLALLAFPPEVSCHSCW
jgi:hypothetical protein